MHALSNRQGSACAHEQTQPYGAVGIKLTWPLACGNALSHGNQGLSNRLSTRQMKRPLVMQCLTVQDMEHQAPDKHSLEHHMGPRH